MADDNAELPGEGDSGAASEMASSEERPEAESVEGAVGPAAEGGSDPDAPSLKSSFTPGQPASTQSKILVVLFATTLIVGGIAIWIFDALGKQTRQLPDINAPRALLIGLAQAIALVPGISRSGATIAAGRALNLERPVAARFSFLISAPIVLGASAALLGNALITHENVNWGPLLFGALVAAATSLAVIRGLLTFIQSHSLRLFVWYRLLVGTAVIISVWIGVL